MRHMEDFSAGHFTEVQCCWARGPWAQGACRMYATIVISCMMPRGLHAYMSAGGTHYSAPGEPRSARGMRFSTYSFMPAA